VLGQYLPLLALFALAVAFAAVSFVASGLLAPRRPTVPKIEPYECGIVPARESPERFPVRFFLVAMIFIVFDVEIIFFYPWAIAHRGLGLFGLVAVLIFTAAVFESFVYLIGHGALDWGPVKHVAPPAVERTAGTTVRRVGVEGREELVERLLAGAPVDEVVLGPPDDAEPVVPTTPAEEVA